MSDRLLASKSRHPCMQVVQDSSTGGEIRESTSLTRPLPGDSNLSPLAIGACMRKHRSPALLGGPVRISDCVHTAPAIAWMRSQEWGRWTQTSRPKVLVHHSVLHIRHLGMSQTALLPPGSRFHQPDVRALVRGSNAHRRPHKRAAGDTHAPQVRRCLGIKVRVLEKVPSVSRGRLYSAISGRTSARHHPWPAILNPR